MCVKATRTSDALSRSFAQSHFFPSYFMPYPSVFNTADVEKTIARINSLTPETKAVWGKMSVDQMLAHLNVSYEMVYTDKHPKPGPIARFLVKTFIKNTVVGPKPYAKNTATAPAFKIVDHRDFEAEKKRLIEYIRKVQQEGEKAFDGRESLSFGPLTVQEWNTLFSKHLDHHLQQFGV